MKDVKIKSLAVSELNVRVLSNPSVHEFTLQINGKANLPVNVRLLDLNGRVLNNYNNLSSNHTLKLGSSLTKGTYIAEVVQGVERKVVKLIKM